MATVEEFQAIIERFLAEYAARPQPGPLMHLARDAKDALGIVDPPPPPTDAEKIAALEAEVADLKAQLESKV